MEKERVKFKDWTCVPNNFKTKEKLNSIGFIKIVGPSNIINVENQEYEVFDIKKCLEVNNTNSLIINSETKNNFLICSCKINKKFFNKFLSELTIMNLDGKILLELNVPQDYEDISDNYFDKINNIIADKILLCYDFESFKTCINQIFIDLDVNGISLNDKKSKTLEGNSLEIAYEILNIVNPKAELFKLRTKAYVYFTKLCNYKKQNGFINAEDIGYEWIRKEYGLSYVDLDFNRFSFEICSSIIDYLHPLLNGFGILPRKY